MNVGKKMAGLTNKQKSHMTCRMFSRDNRAAASFQISLAKTLEPAAFRSCKALNSPKTKLLQLPMKSERKKVNKNK